METRHYIASATPLAAETLHATRTHWRVPPGRENALHWVLDIAFREDESRLRQDHGLQNFAVLRHIALNALKQETPAKMGIKNKWLRAGWDEAHLLKVLNTLLE